MKKSILILVLLVCFKGLLAQEAPFFKSYDWEENPIYKVDNSEESLLALKEKVVTEFYFEEDNLVEYFLEHKVLWLNSDDAIEEFNKVYLPFSSESELQLNKARVITKEGKVIALDDSKILTAEDDETGRKYKYFAFEGVTKGSFIEYIYVVKRAPEYNGKRLDVQSSYVKNKVEFDLFSPTNLIFKFKSFNNVPEVKEDTTTLEKYHWKLQVKNVKKLEDEYLSAYKASKGFIVYKLEGNTANNARNIVSYDKVSQNLYSFYYPDYTEKTQDLIGKFIEELKLVENASEEEKARKIDLFIKMNVFSSDVYSEDLQDLDEVLAKKVSNESGTLKLYIALLRTLNVKHELVLTSDRLDLKFDKEFEANNFLTDFLFYFPKTKKYLSPNDSATRYGFPDPNKTDNYGLFIKEVTIGDFKSAIGKIKYIQPVKATESFDTMLLNVQFNAANLSENKVHFERAFNGYYAMNIQPYTHLIVGDKKEELIDGLVEGITKDLEIDSRELVNNSPELFGVKPLQFIIDFTSEAFVEKAGRKYLFKLGELIGSQIQLYQEKERVLPLENEFQRSYFRTIHIEIPAGYKITNLADINIDNSYTENGEELFSFKSYFTVKDNIVSITADEHYRKNIVKVDVYEEYRKVINSAADFNKIVLLLELK
ncbi:MULTISPECIES: DUF3857 domain-containing protein [unclassified Polaribacter]|uniref:DUF3857 domain-containing protein n=1 Tax=unclassified Polaribacter TaxID=196858 RepID=UPI0011BF42F0|nr:MULTISPECIES: DUF3857 domain-containing protein [unclassified Polaribacter]TXD53393.1 DUF3857 domain-containing protein [Polaribacter sp. IC063]TXD61505.1 DUF3857 domain-containing protein [Polaribacter sp. IC066]